MLFKKIHIPSRSSSINRQSNRPAITYHLRYGEVKGLGEFARIMEMILS